MSLCTWLAVCQHVELQTWHVMTCNSLRPAAESGAASGTDKAARWKAVHELSLAAQMQNSYLALGCI